MTTLWNILHLRALHHDGSNDSQFILEFGFKIPRYLTGCRCHEFWNAWIRTNPPIYDIDKYFEWTVKIHNAVNTKLNKPQMSLDDAKKIYEVMPIDSVVQLQNTKKPEVKLVQSHNIPKHINVEQTKIPVINLPSNEIKLTNTAYHTPSIEITTPHMINRNTIQRIHPFAATLTGQVLNTATMPRGL